MQIVTGAPNVKEGDYIPLALVGAKLPGGEIKLSKLRGVESYGMMCSIDELNLTRITFLTRLIMVYMYLKAPGIRSRY